MNHLLFVIIGAEAAISLCCLTVLASPCFHTTNLISPDVRSSIENLKYSWSVLIAEVPEKFGKPRPLNDIESDLEVVPESKASPGTERISIPAGSQSSAQTRFNRGSVTDSSQYLSSEKTQSAEKTQLQSNTTLMIKKPATGKLKGFISHSETLPPLPDQYMVGKVYSSESGQSRFSQLQRFAVPEWLAGVWLRTEADEVSRVELPRARKVRPAGISTARVRDTFGSYRDQHGQVWQLFSENRSSGQIDRGIALDYHKVHSYDLIITSARSAVVEVLASHTVVSKDSRRILSVYQDEELNSYTLTSRGRLKTDSSVKVFDMFGRPIFLTRSISLQQKIAPFGTGIALSPLYSGTSDKDTNTK